MRPQMEVLAALVGFVSLVLVAIGIGALVALTACAWWVCAAVGMAGAWLWDRGCFWVYSRL